MRSRFSYSLDFVFQTFFKYETQVNIYCEIRNENYRQK